MEYINHTGGAKGADKYWKDLGKPYGVKTIDWRPEHLRGLSKEAHKNMLIDFGNAAIALQRPTIFMGMELCQRNWLQAHHAKAIYAIGYIIPPGEQDWKGHVNKAGKEIVSGGTGWAVEMAIQMDKPVYVFDMDTDWWNKWVDNLFLPLHDTPILTEVFAGIGSRMLTPEGIQAIKNVYIKTFPDGPKGETKTDSGAESNS